MKISQLTAALFAVSFVATVSLTAAAQNPSEETAIMTTATIPATVSEMIPEIYQEVSHRTVSVDGEVAELTRHERRDGRNTGLEGDGGRHDGLTCPSSTSWVTLRWTP